jgi:hypothetical protein
MDDIAAERAVPASTQRDRNGDERPTMSASCARLTRIAATWTRRNAGMARALPHPWSTRAAIRGRATVELGSGRAGDAAGAPPLDRRAGGCVEPAPRPAHFTFPIRTRRDDAPPSSRPEWVQHAVQPEETSEKKQALGADRNQNIGGRSRRGGRVPAALATPVRRAWTTLLAIYAPKTKKRPAPSSVRACAFCEPARGSAERAAEVRRHG